MGSKKHKVSRIFFVVFWVYSFTLVKSQDVECSAPKIPHGFADPSQAYKENEILRYTCELGYNSRTGTYKCTKYGWTGLPECEENAPACPEFSLPNGFTLKSSRGFLYSCDSDYKPFNEKWWEEVICLHGQWSNPPLCIPNNQCGQVPSVYQAKNQARKGYENKAVEEFECESGPCGFKCVDGNWEKRNSEGCPNPAYVQNAVITSHSQQTVTYECRENFSVNGKQTISCINSEWEKTPTCTLDGNFKCSTPEMEINNAFLRTTDLKVYYEEGSKAEYWCKGGFRFENESYATCSAGQWNYPQCNSMPEIFKCPFPEREINNAILRRANLKAYYEEGNAVEYRCEEGFHFKNVSFAKCSAGQWKYPQCISCK